MMSADLLFIYYSFSGEKQRLTFHIMRRLKKVLNRRKQQNQLHSSKVCHSFLFI